MSDTNAPLVRRGRRNARYTAISNEIIDHPTLSPEARIVLIYLLSKQDDWQLQINDLRRLLGTGDKICGRNKSYEVVKELKESAYVIAFEELRNGRFFRLTYYIFDEPHHDPEGFKQSLRGNETKAEAQPKPAGKQADLRPKTPRPEIRETDALPCPDLPYPEIRDITKDRKKQNTESPLPTPNRAKRNDTAEAGRKADFEKFWNEWPEANRPAKRSVAESLFKRLTSQDRSNATEFAKAYRAAAVHNDSFAAMIPYLRNRLFVDFDGAPELDAQGYFHITPKREEWPAWLGHLRLNYGEKVAAQTEQRGFFLPRSRWPVQSENTSNKPANKSFPVLDIAI